MKAKIKYVRSLRGGLCELAKYEELEFESKTQMMKHVRETKKKIAEECHYRWPRDVVNYVLEIE